METMMKTACFAKCIRLVLHENHNKSLITKKIFMYLACLTKYVYLRFITHNIIYLNPTRLLISNSISNSAYFSFFH